MRKVLLAIILLLAGVCCISRDVKADSLIKGTTPSHLKAYFTKYCSSLKFSVTLREPGANCRFEQKWTYNNTTVSTGSSATIGYNGSGFLYSRILYYSISEIKRDDETGEETEVSSDSCQWTIGYLKSYDPTYVKTSDGPDAYGEFYSTWGYYVLLKTDVDTGSINLEPYCYHYFDKRFTNCKSYKVIHTKNEELTGWTKQISEFETSDPNTVLGNIDPYSWIKLEYSYDATTYNSSGSLVEATITITVNLAGAEHKSDDLDVEFSPEYLENYGSWMYVSPEKEYTISSKTEDSEIKFYWTFYNDQNGVITSQVEGNSFTFTGLDGNINCLSCDYEKVSSGTDHYILYNYGTGWYLYKAELLTVPAIDYLSCNTPYSIGNGVTVDLKTGDAKVYQTDLVLSGKGGLDLNLTRIFSGRANMLSSSGNIYHGAFQSMIHWWLDVAQVTAYYGGAWSQSFPSVYGLITDSTSESILTQPMPGWSYDIPRITPYFIYFEGKLYPNSLEADRRKAGDYAHYFWPEGCKRNGDTYYFQKGNFKLAGDGDSSVILTKADGTRYAFPCEYSEEIGGWTYYPLAKIVGKSGNQLSFTYGEQNVTIVDSAGRTIYIDSSGVKVNDITVVSFSVQYDGDIPIYTSGDADYQTITYMVTDAAGRTNTMIMGTNTLDLTSSTGETTHLDFSDLTCQDESVSHEEFGLCLTGGTSRGREISVEYQMSHHVLSANYLYSNVGIDSIDSITLKDGSESITADFSYTNLTKYKNIYYPDAPYGLHCPGPSSSTTNLNTYNYSYEQRDNSYSGSNTPLNNQFQLLSLVKVSGPHSYTRSFTYDDTCNLISETGPDGTKTYTYQTIDSGSLYFTGLSSVTHGTLTTAYRYDSYGRLTSVKQGDVDPTAYTYDSSGNVVQITDPNGNATSIAYDSAYGLFPVSVMTGERTQTFEYESPFGWLKSQTMGPYTTSYTHDAIGRVLTVTDSAGTVTTAYDDTALQVKTIDYEGNVTKTSYDAIGRCVSAESIDSLGAGVSTASYAYDPQYDYRVTSITTDSGTQTYTYDDSAASTAMSDTDGNSVSAWYDALGRKTKTISSYTGGGDTPGTETTAYTYDGGLLSQVTDSGHTVNYTYNSRGLVTGTSYSDGKTEAFSYDANGNVLSATGRDGRIFNYDYNNYDEVVKVKLPTGDVIAAYTYDTLGRIETVTGAEIAYHNYFDDQGYLTHTEQTVKGRLYDLGYEYGLYDRIKTVTLKDKNATVLTQFGYDYTYPNTTVSALVGGELKVFATATSGKSGLLSQTQLGNGLIAGYMYDGRQRLEKRTINTGSDYVVQTHQYAYDKGGNIKTLDTEAYTYDSLNRLTGVTGGLKSLAYTYDTSGKRTQAIKGGVTTSYTYEHGLLKQAGNITFSYNADGSRALKTQDANHWDYIYDDLGQLQSVMKDDATIGTYGYDPSGWRIWKEEDGKTTLYIRDGDQTIYQETFSGTVDASSTPETSRAFVYLGSELAGTITDGTEARYYTNDHLGTTELVTDSSGTVLNTIRNTPFGDEVDIRSTLSKLEKAVDDGEIIDTANTTAVISDGQAVPVKTVQSVEKLLYSSDESSSILDPHFVTVQQYTYEYADTDVLQLKVVSKISYEGSAAPVEKVEYIDLTDKTLGKYKISLDLRKDVGTDTPTESQKFAVYVSKMKAYTASRIQTIEIPVTSGANTFILTQEGTGLTNITWAYSADGGSSWTEFTAGSDTDLNGATSIILRATLTPGDELPTLTSFKVTFVSVESESEDFTFTGKEKDASGLYYFGARYYDPEVGEFISEDPGMDGTDWYGYCQGNPVRYVDPDGRKGVLAKGWKYTVATVEVVGGSLSVIGGYTMIAGGIATTETGIGPFLGIAGGSVVLAHGGNAFASGIYDFRCLLSGNESGFGKFNWLKDNVYSKLPAGSTLYYVVDILSSVKGTATAFNSMFKGISNVTLKGTQLSYKLGNKWRAIEITSVKVVSLTVSKRVVQGLLVVKDGITYYIDAKGWHEVKD